MEEHVIDDKHGRGGVNEAIRMWRKKSSFRHIVILD
jgi:hypothetical protein